MTKFSFLLIFSFLAVNLFAQAPTQAERFSQVKVYFGDRGVEDLAKLGLDAVHGDHRPGVWLTSIFSEREIKLIQDAGFSYDIITKDVVEAYHNVTWPSTHFRGNDCPNSSNKFWTTPNQYTSGSMGGYLTLTELYAVLDTMAARYPNLISPKMVIDTFKTQEDRPIYYLKVSNHPNIDEDKPEILYTALHHAREPNSLSQMVFYMWYLLENYESDEEIKFLVDHVELFFIPCVNPDGYVYNETSQPNGGGLWRKNRRIINGEAEGVDLNRNYDFHWGYDNTGSSPDPSSNTYRGPSAASEPEIKAVNFLTNQHEFEIALNYHTYGNLLIHPWGYSDQTTPDHATFSALGSAMISENNFLLGTGTSTVGYTVNGDSDDWMYGAKDIFSMTPEAGPQGAQFWPQPNEIDEINKSTIYQNIVAAQLLLNFAQAQILTHAMANEGVFDVQVVHPGLKQGASTLAMTSLHPSVEISTPAYSLNMQHLDTIYKGFDYSVTGSISEGAIVQVELAIDNGGYWVRDTLDFTYWSNSDIAFSENGETIDSWTGNWAFTTEKYHSPTKSITDSPMDNYSAGTNQTILSPEIDLTNTLGAELTFFAIWDIENNYDYAQVFATTDNGTTAQPLCGAWTNTGTQDQDDGQPIYDGKQSSWVSEYIDLQDFIGLKIKIGFKIKADQYLEKDGFYFDDLKITKYLSPNGTSSTHQDFHIKVFPTIVDDIFNIQLAQKRNRPLHILVFNNLGEIVQQDFLEKGIMLSQTDVSALPSGVYFVKISQGSKQIFQKIIKQ